MTSLLDTPAGRYFIKAISTKHPEVSVALVRDELDVLERLPEVSPPVPTLRAKVRVGGWIALVTDAVPGRSPGPGVGDGLPAGLDALSQLRDAVPCAPAGLPSVADRYAGLLAHVPSLLQRQPELVPAGAPPGATEETVDRILAESASGSRLVHGDLRGDNTLLDSGGPTWLVDWAWGCHGQPWFDAVTLSCSMDLDPWARWDLLEKHELTSRVAPTALWHVALAVASLYAWCSRQPPPPGLDELRSWQRDQEVTALAFVRSGLDRGVAS